MAHLLHRRSSMKNNSFDRAMGKIVAQAEAERQQEIKARQRAEWFGRVRNAFILLFIATVLIFACNFHDRLGELVATIMPPKAADTTSGSKEPSGKAAAALQGAGQNAAVRDQLIDSLAK